MKRILNILAFVVVVGQLHLADAQTAPPPNEIKTFCDNQPNIAITKTCELEIDTYVIYDNVEFEYSLVGKTEPGATLLNDYGLVPNVAHGDEQRTIITSIPHPDLGGSWHEIHQISIKPITGGALVENIEFRNVAVKLEIAPGPNYVRVKNNTFISSSAARMDETLSENADPLIVKIKQVDESDRTRVVVDSNIFLRPTPVQCLVELDTGSEKAPARGSEPICGSLAERHFKYDGGDAITLYRVIDAYVVRNVIGGISDEIWAANLLSNDMRDRLRALSLRWGVADRGFFQTGINVINAGTGSETLTYTPGDGTQIDIFDNVIRGVTNAEVSGQNVPSAQVDRTTNFDRDHAIYASLYNGLKLCNNFVSGWPEDEDGGVKLRNAHNTTVCHNHFDRTHLLTYIYEDKPDSLVFTDAYLFGNSFYVSKVDSPDTEKSVIKFWQRCDPTTDMLSDSCNNQNVGPISIYDNTFELLNANGNVDPNLSRTEPFISLKWKGLRSATECPPHPVFRLHGNTTSLANTTMYDVTSDPGFCTIDPQIMAAVEPDPTLLLGTYTGTAPSP